MKKRLPKYAYIPHAAIEPKSDKPCKGDLVARIIEEDGKKVLFYKCDWCWKEFGDSGILNALLNTGKDPAHVLACLDINAGTESGLAE